eukprot:c9972_g1_i1.p1 GENE.c9972_g1_i1~~c9972_g1_i1.p1  ORF type:complete len:582 (+),score=107.31 c9972_g1_i1:1358-3103(+)
MPIHQPMITVPKPWLGNDIGGYLSHRIHIMRFANDVQKQALRNAHPKLTRVYEALTILGKVPWIVNRKVFDTMMTIWEQGGGVGKLPSRKNLDLPPCPDPSLLNIPTSEMTDAQKAIMKDWKRQCAKINRHNSDLHSMRCDTMYKLETAAEFKDQVMYFPHNLDFRGRAYPIPHHLNHMGSDVCRSLLVFAKGKRLGTRGLYWLKIHLANLFGKDKLSLSGRIAFVDEHVENIIDSARDPLGGKRWWMKGEEPFQCLGACVALGEALMLKNPEDYICHLPIHQDGSCNGLQHYAALGRDAAGGLAVNLVPAESDTPQDVYTKVLEQVARRVHEDALTGHKAAMLLDGKIDRKIVKQTVMTSVYGVTFVGAREQILNRLSERKVVGDDVMFECSSYLARQTLSGLADLFSSAFKIMEWLATCAHIVGKQANKATAWTTPLGLPVIQPYHKRNHGSVKTLVQNITLVLRQSTSPVSTGQQKSAFPPNFVHSLDSTHMLMTAIKCDREDIAFAAVHDCFWTHACDVDRMNHILRQEFVDIHSQPILENLRSEFQRQCPDLVFPPLPERGKLDLTKVLDSPYFFD